MSINYGYREQFTPWHRDGFLPGIIEPSQQGVMRLAILNCIEETQHRPLKYGAKQLKQLEAMEVTVSVTDDAIDHMMGVGHQ